MRQNLVLLNFRLPIEIKNRFQALCEKRHQKMTCVLNQMILDFIEADQQMRARFDIDDSN